MTDALLEIGCEELPVSYIEPAIEQMMRIACTLLEERMVGFKEPVETGATPRRLVLFIKDIAEKSQQKTQQIVGPPERMYRDHNGEYTPAAIGFSKKTGVPANEFIVVNGKICAEIKIGGERTKKILEEIFPAIIRNIKFPKSMVWEETGFRFARPIRHIAALLGSDVVRFALAGVKSGRSTVGIHALSSKKIEIPSAGAYFKKLEDICIRVDHKDRKQYITSLVSHSISPSRGRVLIDEELLHENTFLVEIPTVVVGGFDTQYLDLPKEVLVTCLKAKQKFFTVIDNQEHILPYFVGIRNGRSEYQSVVQQGYERVLKARLEDAKFFVEQDKKIHFEQRLQKLKGVVFHEQLGTLFDKTERIKKTGEYLCAVLKVDCRTKEFVARAASRCKTDLVTSLVFEYPELQGIAGRIYAQGEGETPEVCRAIEEHYKPIGQDDDPPSSCIGAIIGLADKVDSLAGYFLAGIEPSGNKDPLGLRRIALGIIRIILHHQLTVDLKKLLSACISNFSESLRGKKEHVLDDILLFIRQRIEVVFSSTDYARDEILAIVNAVWMDKTDSLDINDARIRITTIHEFRKQPALEALLSSYKRADNIISQAREKKLSLPETVDTSLPMQDPERILNERFNDIREQVEQIYAQKIESPLSQDDYAEILKHLVTLREPLDNFFNTTMVMVEDEGIRANRLAILNEIVRLYQSIADFSQIVQT